MDEELRRKIFPSDLFRKPLDLDSNGNPKFNFEEEPLKKKLLESDMMNSELLRKALNTNLTEEFVTTLYLKATRNPPENIIIEEKGSTRGGKSTVGIAIAKLISGWTRREFTAANIFQNQSEFLYKVKGMKFGEVYIIDEQKAEAFGDGVIRESEQIHNIVNICAKRCINLIFIHPQQFVGRNAEYGLETIAKDMKNKYVKCFYHDLRNKAYGFGGNWPSGYITIPKYQEKAYQILDPGKWSDYRKQNMKERGYDFDSQLEEDYEVNKDKGIEEVMNMNSGIRDRKKEEIAEMLAADSKFINRKNNIERKAYLQLLMNHKKVMELAKSEYDTIIGMAVIIAEGGIDEVD